MTTIGRSAHKQPARLVHSEQFRPHPSSKRDWAIAPGVRAGAADALRQLGEAGIEALRRALRHADPYARDRAQEALVLEGLIGSDE